jgi:hypothetical protein
VSSYEQFAARDGHGSVFRCARKIENAISRASQYALQEKSALRGQFKVETICDRLSIAGMNKTPLTIVMLFSSLALVAMADAPLPKSRQLQIFKGMDTDRDGGISLEEWKASMSGNISPVRIEKVFREKDRNSDGKLNVEELFYVVQDQRPVAPDKKKDDTTSKNQ